MKTPKLAFTASPRPDARRVRQELMSRYEAYSERDADIIIVLGGDGTMLEALRRRFSDPKPVYGINCGTVGFLLNENNENVEMDLFQRLEQAEEARVAPLRMQAKKSDGEEVSALAINEVSIFRQTAQSANLRVIIDGKIRLKRLACDGILVATPAGSTAYNLSAHGPILPVSANLLALTPISAFRPRRWRGALLQQDAEVMIEVSEANTRPVSASADNFEVRDTVHIKISSAPENTLSMLFDPGHALEERILREQFEV